MSNRKLTRTGLNHSSPVVFPAFFANTVDLEGMASGLVMVFAADFLLQAVHFRRKEFDGSAAVGADHVVMAAAVVLVFVASNPVVEGDFTGQSALGQQLQRAIYRGKADSGIAFAHQLVQLFGGEMFVGLKEGKQNSVALLGLFESNFLQVLMKTVLRLAQRFARDGNGIIDAFLKHEKPS